MDYTSYIYKVYLDVDISETKQWFDLTLSPAENSMKHAERAHGLEVDAGWNLARRT